MFCSNCGSKVPDGSKFCSVCGTRLAEVEPAGKEVYSYSGRGMTEPETNETFAKSPSRVSFDWSNVIEEPVKKVTPNVRSPWDEMQVEDRPRVNKPSVDHRRTMSFIEILKQEREEKLQAAEAEAKAVTEREEATPDFSVFDDAPQIYTPQVYEDIKPVEKPVEEFKTGTPYEEVNFEQPAFEEPKYEEPFSFENDFEEPLEVQSPSSTPAEFEAVSAVSAVSNKDDSDIYVDTNMFESVEPSNTAKSVEDFYSVPEEVVNDANPRSLEAELDEILNANYGNRIPRSQRYEEFKTEPEVELEPIVEPEPVVEEATYVEPVVEPVVEAAPVVEPIVEAEPVVEPVIEQFDYNEPAQYVEEETVSLDELIAEPSTRPSDPAKSTIAPPAEDESEIAELKKRLSELMSSPEPEDLTKPAVELEDYDTSMFEPNVAVQEPEVTNFAAPSEEPASNELTLDDLEKELFGEEIPGDVDAEATKKIDKFYTLYKKNEEFQRLLDEEYNKLKEEETQAETEEVEMPVVEKFEPTPEPEIVPVETEPVPVEKAAATVEEAAVAEEPVVIEKEAPAVEEAPATKEDKAAAKQAKKEAKAAAKQAKKEAKASDSADEEEGSGGGALTVFAVIIAFLLVILLGVILVLNFAPDSGIAMTINSAIGNIASYFSATDAIKDVLL